MTITALGITREEDSSYQMSLFDDKKASDKKEHLEDAFYELKKRFGDGMIKRGNMLNMKDRTDPADDEDRYIPFHGLEKK
jgi:hypothetical protein